MVHAKGPCLFSSETGPGESQQWNDRSTVAGDALQLPTAVITDVIQATWIFTADTPVPGKEEANIGFVCLCVSQLVLYFFSSSSWQHLRIHDVASSPRILQHHAVRNKGAVCSSSYLGIITVCDMLAFLSLWFLALVSRLLRLFFFSFVHSHAFNYLI